MRFNTLFYANSLISPIRLLRTYSAFFFLGIYLWAMAPKGFPHDHDLTPDKNHTEAEHCNNVIHNVKVSNDHKCNHKSHLHTRAPHCFACDNHYTSLHTNQNFNIFSFSAIAIQLESYYILPLHKNIASGIYNKGPPTNI